MDNNLKIFLSAKISKLKLTANDLPDLFKLATKKFSAPAVEIWKMIAECFYEQAEHNNCLVALDFYAQELSLTTEEIGLIIIERYAREIEEYKKNYEYNVELLKNYQWCFQKEFPSFASLGKILLFHNDELRITIDKKNMIIDCVAQDIVVAAENIGEDIFFLIGIINFANLLKLEQQISNENNYLAQGGKNPIYLYYDKLEVFYLLIMQNKLEELLNTERVVFFLKESELKSFLYDEYAMIPNKFVAEQGNEKLMEKIIAKIEKTTAIRIADYDKNICWNKEYYIKNKGNILANIRGKKPKILFVTTRFSTAVQYHTRDCIEACQRLGCETELIIEPSDIHRNYWMAYSKIIKNFYPDIYFQIDHFANREIIPKEIIGVNWFQDPLPHLTAPRTPLTLTKKDYILALDVKGAKNIGYLPEQIMLAAILANHLIYQPYKLSDQERERYSADIILVANSNDLNEKKRALINSINDNKQPKISDRVIEKILRCYYQLAYEEKINLTNIKITKEYLSQEIKIHCHEILEDDILSKLAEEFFIYTKATVFRNVLTEWLIDGGYTNLKLYGNDWASNKKFAPYAMGVAPNGEILSKIYQSAKIVLGTNIHNTGPARVYETFLSGGFYLANYIVPEYDTMNIRDKYLENEEIPFFYNRQDLYAKLDYFLANPDECKKITERTRAKMLENDTYEALMKRMLDWLAEKV